MGVRSMVLAAVLCLPVTQGCSFVAAIERFDLENPAPELGRAGWVRGASAAGAWTGGIVGGVVSVVLLPVTLPVRWLRGEAAPDDRDLLFPVAFFAGVGHGLVGGPADTVDMVVRRAWVADPADGPTEEELSRVPR